MQIKLPKPPAKLPEDLRLHARELRTRMTDVEVLLWALLRNRRLEYDRQRDVWLSSQGVRVMRFWNNQVLLETEAVVEAIYLALNER